MKKTSTIRFLKVAFCAICLLSIVWMPVPAFSQANKQRDLLERAFETKSYDLLATFFDNWQQDYADNEAEAPDKWVAEAHKVFAAICRPNISSKIGSLVEIQGPFLIVQGTLGKIGYVKMKSKAFIKGDLDETVYFTIDSAVNFRPRFQLEGLTTIYLTDNYRAIVNDFFSTFNPPPAQFDYNMLDDWELKETDSVWTVTGNDKEPYDEFEAKLQEQRERVFFVSDYAGNIYCPHMFGPTKVVPFFTIEEIIFDRSLQYAVVKYRKCISGGTFVLKKVKNEWVFDHQHEWWIE